MTRVLTEIWIPHTHFQLYPIREKHLPVVILFKNQPLSNMHYCRYSTIAQLNLNFRVMPQWLLYHCTHTIIMKCFEDCHWTAYNLRIFPNIQGKMPGEKWHFVLERFSSAFNKINPENMTGKLRLLGLNSFLCNWISASHDWEQHVQCHHTEHRGTPGLSC